MKHHDQAVVKQQGQVVINLALLRDVSHLQMNYVKQG